MPDTALSTGPRIWQQRVEAQRSRRLAAHGDDVGPHARLGRRPGGSSWKIALRTWRIVTSRSATVCSRRSRTAGWRRHLGGRLERQPGRRTPAGSTSSWRSLGDALALFEQGHRTDVLVQAGVLDRQPGRRGERDDELLVDVGEHLAVGLVGQVQVPEHLVARAGSARRGTSVIGGWFGGNP